jgi:hypothetical protein
VVFQNSTSGAVFKLQWCSAWIFKTPMVLCLTTICGGRKNPVVVLNTFTTGGVSPPLEFE